MALTFGGSLVAAIGSVILFIVLAMHAADHDWPRPAFYATFAIPLCGLLLPTQVMRFLPCICPRCGGKAQLGVAATTSILPIPRYAWSCTVCDWSTYYWSKYQQAQRDAQRRKSRRFFKRLFSFEWLRRRGG
jgi:hypothetical protein